MLKMLTFTNLSSGCYGIAVSPSGLRLAVSDTAGNRVYVINAVNGTTDLGWEPLPGSLWHRKVASVGRFCSPFQRERACYP